ncbi:MAG: 4Fe-4S dicluster domain-containing protein [Planctomycetota bacterium]
MPAYYIDDASLPAFLFGLDAAAVYAQTAVEGGEADFERLDPQRPPQLDLRAPRAPTSVKQFLFPAKERVAVYPSADYDWTPPVSGEEPMVVAGLRACDVAAAGILDQVFIQGDYVDPFYSLRRDALRMVTVDCGQPAESCFCTLLGGKPYATEGFDVNLSPIEGGWVVESGSDKGREMLVASMDRLAEATPDQLAARDAMRRGAESRLAKQNAEFTAGETMAEIATRAADDSRWLQLAAGCVECGSCSTICPTCHCFQLYDQASDAEAGPNERMKVWDSCLTASYAKMAGAGGMKASPRPELRQRFANRILHKFAWFPENMDCLGCVGCGRCTDACLGERDIRQLFLDLRAEATA